MSKSWYKQELDEKRKILQAFWNQCMVTPDEKNITATTNFVISVHFPKDAQWEENVKSIMKKALMGQARTNEIRFDDFFNLFKDLPRIDIGRINVGANLGVTFPMPPEKENPTISSDDLSELRRYLQDTHMSAAVALGLPSGESVVPDFPENQSAFAFTLHSVGKVFTGMLIMELVRKGVITAGELDKPGVKLDEAITQKLPSAIRERLQQVTLHQLMTHTAGFGNYLDQYLSALAHEEKPKIESLKDFLPFFDQSTGYELCLMRVKDTDALSDLGLLRIEGRTPVILVKKGETVYVYGKNTAGKIGYTQLDADKFADITFPEVGRETKLDQDQKYAKVYDEIAAKGGCARYSNAGMVLLGLAIEHLCQKSYYDVLREYVVTPAQMECFSMSRPKENAQWNPDDPVILHMVGSSAGGSWTTAKDLAKFGQWIYECSKDPEMKGLLEKYGQEFYDAKLQTVSHSGGAGNPLSSAFLEVSLKTGAVVAVFSNDAMAPVLTEMVQRNIFHQEIDTALTSEVNAASGNISEPSSESKILSTLKVTSSVVPPTMAQDVAVLGDDEKTSKKQLCELKKTSDVQPIIPSEVP